MPEGYECVWRCYAPPSKEPGWPLAEVLCNFLQPIFSQSTNRLYKYSKSISFVKLSKNEAIERQMLPKSHWEDVVKKRTVLKWVRRFWQGCKNPTLDARSAKAHCYGQVSDRNAGRYQVLIQARVCHVSRYRTISFPSVSYGLSISR